MKSSKTIVLNRFFMTSLFVASGSAAAWADPTSVEHNPSQQVFNEPTGVTMREQPVPREGEVTDLWARIGFQFAYNNVAIYLTWDGVEPQGSFGVAGNGSTTVLLNGGAVQFRYNEPTGMGTYDWWQATLPPETRVWGRQIRYKISAWQTGGGELFANGGAAYSFTVKLAWPGAGAGQPSPQAGYPPVNFWKEEALVGNHYINAMIDQNGTLFDLFYPGAGGRFGVGTRNEGYVDGADTFPAFTSGRGQMHVNQFMCGLRIDGLTHWLSNPNGVSYDQVTQGYASADSNVVSGSLRLHGGGNNIAVVQHDFCPAGIAFPNDLDGAPNRGIYVKRLILTNNGVTPKTVSFYAYGDWAVNGGDGFDSSYQDAGASHGAMVCYDNAGGTALSRGEYNPRSDGIDYPKDVSIFLGTALKVCSAVGSAGGTPATDFWSDTSSDIGQGWIGTQLTLAPGVPVEIDLAIVGGFRTGLHVDVADRQIRPALDWFFANSMATVQAATHSYWQNWIAGGVTVDLPDDRYDTLFQRGLLATALHVDGASGAVVAGYHNGAYPYCWPRDAVYGAVSLARTGHLAESAGVYAWMRDVCFRDNEAWGKGFWKQKYTTDGHVVWFAPQIDETAVFPWGVYYHYLITGDIGFLSAHYASVRDSVFTCSTSPGDPGLLPRLNYNAIERLMWSNNIWEDSYNFFIYSNANIVRGLWDAAAIATTLGQPGDAADFNNRANTIKGGLDERLDENREYTDISQLGIVYPFRVYSPTDARAVRYIDRINSIHPDEFGSTAGLVNFTNTFGWLDLINRYVGDQYWGNNSTAWGAGPWFLSTMWYGLYYAERQDYTAGRGDIDNHRHRLDLLLDHLGPIGFGAEQIAPYCGTNCGSLLYANQTDFTLQTAWPNAWESMSTFADSIMAFLDFQPDAPANRIVIAPKHPTGWSTMTFRNLPMRDQRVTVTSSETPTYVRNLLTNLVGGTVGVDTTIRVPVGPAVFGATRDGAAIAFATTEPALGRYRLTTTLNGGAGATTDLRVHYGVRGDLSGNGAVDSPDVADFVAVLLGYNTDPIDRAICDMNVDGTPDGKDVQLFVEALLP